MSKFCLILLLVLFAGGVYAQQESFVLLQTENDQPFYARIGEKTLSSSPQGHLILSQLKDSAYHLTIGFPKKLFPEQDFTLVIDGKDRELRLKNFGDRGWSLFNPQTLELQMPAKKDSAEEEKHVEGVKKDDAFSRLMAGVVNDTMVMYNTHAMDAYLRESAHPADSSRLGGNVRPGDSSRLTGSGRLVDSSRLNARVHPGDSSLLSGSAYQGDSSRLNGGGHPIEDSRFNGRTQPGDHSSSIEKLSEQRTATDLRQSYTDQAKGYKTDTIGVLIPMDTILQVKDNQQDTNSGGTKPHNLPEGMNAGEKDTLKSDTDAGGQQKEKGKPIVLNSDCRNFASDDDVEKLKARLLAAPSDEARITAARKVFKIKCFSTSQLRSLSGVFTLESSKYDFLEKAYPFVSDDQFKGLSDLFTDPVYQSKFNTLIGAGSP